MNTGVFGHLRQGIFVQFWRWRLSQQFERPARMGAPDAPPAGHEPRDFRGSPRHSFRRSRRSIDLCQSEAGGPLMQFRRPSVRYGRTPEPETPYQKAAQAWDERIGAGPASRPATGGSSPSATCSSPRLLPAA